MRKLQEIDERRGNRRFTIAMKARLKVSQKRGECRRWKTVTTKNISSSGALLVSPALGSVALRSRIEVEFSQWPAQRDDNRTVAVIGTGFVVRQEGNTLGVRFTSFKFDIAAKEVLKSA